MTFTDRLTAELRQLESDGLQRRIPDVSDHSGTHLVIGGRQLILFCSNDYLGLSRHPRLAEAARSAIERFGTSSGASRLVSGTSPLHRGLEEEIARFKGTERALVFNSGYAANTGIVSALVGRGDTIFSDRLNHASIVDGALLSGARLVRYRHRDMDHLRRLMRDERGKGKALIVTDGVFSMDGDVAPLSDLVRIKTEFDALLMVDDAHGTGVMGNEGRGSVDAAGVSADVDIQMGTFGKALGSFGAYVAASRTIVDYLINRSRSFIFSTSLPPAVIAANSAAVALVRSEEGENLRRRLWENVDLFTALLHEAGISTEPSTTQIVPIVVGDERRTMEAARMLQEEGVFVQGIRPPTVPRGTSRLRCAVSAAHATEDVRQVAGAVIRVLRRVGGA